MKDFVAYIVKNLVANPDAVQVTEIAGTSTLVLELSVEKSDYGKIIGKEGRTINALRTIILVAAARKGLRVSLEVLEKKSD